MESADTALNASCSAEHAVLVQLGREAKPLRRWGIPQLFGTRFNGDLFLIPRILALLEGRIGTWEDGGSGCALSIAGVRHGGGSTAVSVGCRGETSFESDMFTRLGMAPHTLDFPLGPAMQEKMRHKKFMKFYNLGLSGRDQLLQLQARVPAMQRFLRSRNWWS